MASAALKPSSYRRNLSKHLVDAAVSGLLAEGFGVYADWNTSLGNMR